MLSCTQSFILQECVGEVAFRHQGARLEVARDVTEETSNGAMGKSRSGFEAGNGFFPINLSFISVLGLSCLVELSCEEASSIV